MLLFSHSQFFQNLSENKKLADKFDFPLSTLSDKEIQYLPVNKALSVGKGEEEPRSVWKRGEDYLAVQPADMSGVEVIQLREDYINQFKKTNPILFEQLHQLNRRTEGKVITMEFNPDTAPAANPELLKFVKYK